MMRHVGVAILLLLPRIVAAQTSSPEFEAASVKPVPLGTPYGGMRGGPGTSSPGQISYSATSLRAITARAYGVQRFQIVGPPWFDEERFDIVAKIPPKTSIHQLQLMLQKLLADRFKMQLHRENRISVVYEMTIAKSGLKMKALPLPQTPDPALSAVSPAAPSASGVMEFHSGEKIVLEGQRVTMRQIIVTLTEKTDRPIVDKTGLTEAYDFDMSWTPGNDRFSNEHLLQGIGDSAPVAGNVGDTIFSALERYLGLKLVPRKGPVEMLVIDRLERVPTAN